MTLTHSWASQPRASTSSFQKIADATISSHQAAILSFLTDASNEGKAMPKSLYNQTIELIMSTENGSQSAIMMRELILSTEKESQMAMIEILSGTSREQRVTLKTLLMDLFRDSEEVAR